MNARHAGSRLTHSSTIGTRIIIHNFSYSLSLSPSPSLSLSPLSPVPWATQEDSDNNDPKFPGMKAKVKEVTKEWRKKKDIKKGDDMSDKKRVSESGFNFVFVSLPTMIEY